MLKFLNHSIQLRLIYLKYALLLTAFFLMVECKAQYSQYVWAKNGLTLRTSASKTGEKIKTLPYGTKVEYLERTSDDSVLIIPACKLTDGSFSQAFFLKGNWAKVKAGQDIGFLFDGYLSEMQPYKPSQENIPYGMDGIVQWNLQQASMLDTFRIANNYNDFSVAYSNHVVQSVHISEGGGNSKLIFPAGRSFKDGFLLLNYFSNLNFTEKKLKETEGFEIKVSEISLFFESIGFEGGIYWMFSICFDNGVLILTIGAGC